ncbi:MAG: class I SAM-dependent methyltransferase [Verrucomicrobiia bacterium]|jgi:phosphatidylethanolamine/phosphatidyl-N-methylethanolamine N-methyltransferase
MAIKTLRSYAAFGGAFFSDCRTTGSIIPSSPFLGRRMARAVPKGERGLIVELGVGTGAITKSLFDHGIPPEKLVSVDCSPEMVEWTQKRFPHANVKLGDATRLRDLLESDKELRNHDVAHIVSSLPFKSLPKTVGYGIVEEAHRVLAKDGRFVQFTYDLRSTACQILGRRFQLVDSSIVWINFPPARVNVYAPI